MACRASRPVPLRLAESDLVARLGSSSLLWDFLLANLAALGVSVQEWKCYAKKAG
jgi:hypothetical protein